MGDKNKKGRFPNQVNRLSCHDQIVILLVTGNISEFMNNMKKLGVSVDIKILYGALASVACREHIHVIWIDKEWDALVTMVTFMQKVDDGKYGVPSKRDPDILLARYLKLTPQQWKELKTKFSSLATIANATEKDLMCVNGIGKVKAKGIKSALLDSW